MKGPEGRRTAQERVRKAGGQLKIGSGRQEDSSREMGSANYPVAVEPRLDPRMME